MSLLHLDTSRHDPACWLLQGKYPGKPERIEDFKEKELLGITVRRPIAFTLLFYPKEGQLNLHLPRGKAERQEAILEAFSKAFVENSSSFCEGLEKYIVSLDALKICEELDLPDEDFPISKIEIIGLEYKLDGNYQELPIFSISNFAALSLPKACDKFKLTAESLNLLSVSLHFYFSDKGKKKRKLIIKSNSRINLKTSNHKDEMMRQCLQHWGVLAC